MVKAAQTSTVATWLERAALWTLLLVIAMRALITETYDSLLPDIVRAVGFSSDNTPATTAGFGVAVWLAAVAATVALAMRRKAWRWTGTELGWAVMFAGAIISVQAASNQRVAINASADWLTAGVMAFVLANLCRDRLRIALVLAVISASGCAAAAKCLMQVNLEYPETRQQYEQMKEQFWAAQDVAPDDPAVDLYERRMGANEATGFFPFSNVQGSGLMLAGFGALTAAAMVGRLQGLAGVLIGVYLFGVLLTTGSRGAMVATVVGLAALGALFALRRAGGLRWRTVVAIGWVLVGAGALGVWGVGQSQGGLIVPTLTFRWHYWEVTRDIIAESPWTGTGALNFEYAYLKHKPIEYPEEIKDPHNFLISLAAQWGLLGGVGILIALAGGSWCAVRLAFARNDDEPAGETPAIAFPWRWAVMVVAGYVGVRLLLFMDHFLRGAEGVAFLTFDLGFFGLIWIGVFVAVLGLVAAGKPRGVGYRLVLLAAVIAFLLHSSIDFSMMYPGTLTPFMAITALLFARPESDAESNAGLIRLYVPRIAAIAGLLLFTVNVYWPVSAAMDYLQDGRTWAAQISQQPDAAKKATESFNAAIEADPLDPTPWLERASLTFMLGGWETDTIDAALTSLAEAAKRDPLDAGIIRSRAGVLKRRYEVSGEREDLIQAEAAVGEVLALYPESPDDHLARANLLSTMANELGEAQWARQAVHHYQEALRLDAARPGPDEARRWSPDRRGEIERDLQDVRMHLEKDASQV